MADNNYKIRNIDIFYPAKSQYGALYHFTYKLHEALVRAGYQSHLFDNNVSLTDLVLKPPADLSIGFNGALMTEEGHFMPDLFRTPHVSCLVDPIFRFYHLVKSPYMIIGCDDRFGCEILHQSNFQNTIFFPHAVEKDLAPGPDNERIYDVVFLGTFIDYEKRRNDWKHIYSKGVFQAMEEAIELTFSDQETSFIEAFRMTINYHRKESGDLGVFNYFEIFHELEMYLKGKERMELLQSIQDAEIHVFGSSSGEKNWKTQCKNRPNIVVHDSVSYDESLEIMKKSKIILNSSLKNKNGAHERIFNGLAAGALVLTGENIYLREYFKDEENILFYRFSEAKQINQKINDYLAHESKRKEVVAHGREIVMKHHTWDQRVETLFEDIKPILATMPLRKQPSIEQE
jgi:spore maturation protein CgeB